MLSEADSDLRGWAEPIVADLEPGASVELCAPGSCVSKPSVSLYLLDLESVAPKPDYLVTRVSVRARYLVTSYADSDEAAHRLLGALIVAGVAESRFEVEVSRLGADTWLALGVAPRPSFAIRMLCSAELERIEVPQIESASVDVAPMHGAIED